MNYYFAYGSNMDMEQMRERCPEAVLLGAAFLRHYQLAFTIFSPTRLCGCADVVSKAGAVVHGLLYQLSDSDLARMDKFEGHPQHYRRTVVTVTHRGRELSAATYEVVAKVEHLRPSSEYLGLLKNAAQLHGFPRQYQDFLESVPVAY